MENKMKKIIMLAIALVTILYLSADVFGDILSVAGGRGMTITVMEAITEVESMIMTGTEDMMKEDRSCGTGA